MKKLTVAQKSSVSKMKSTTKNQMHAMQPNRLVKAINWWILAKNDKGATAVFEITCDKDAREFVTAVAEELGLDATSTEFKTALTSIKANDPYKKVKYKDREVPAATVEEVCTTYPIKRDAIVEAIKIDAAPTGDNGVKKLQGGLADKYSHELKLMAMGGYRLYAKNTKRDDKKTKLVFDEIGKHA